MKRLPIIIEITGLEGSGKSTLINQIKKDKLFKNIIFTDNKYIDIYNKKNIINKIYSKFSNIVKNINFYNKLIQILIKNNHISLLSPIEFYITNIYLNNIDTNNNILISDEFLLHLIYGENIKKYKSNKINIENLDNIISIFQNINIYPIHIKTDFETHIRRTKKRNKIAYDKLSNTEKRNILEKNGFLSEYIVKKYCEIKNIKYLEIDGNLDLNHKLDELVKNINYIIKYKKNQ